MRTTAQLVRSWYEVHRNNDEHPFTIPQRSLVALVAAVQAEMDALQQKADLYLHYVEIGMDASCDEIKTINELNRQIRDLQTQLAERDAEQLAAPTHEEEG